MRQVAERLLSFRGAVLSLPPPQILAGIFNCYTAFSVVSPAMVALVRIPCSKSRRKFLAKSNEWVKEHRHWKRQDQQKQLTRMLRGFYQYFGLNHCKPKLDGVRREVQR
jgi:hypothetical protein